MYIKKQNTHTTFRTFDPKATIDAHILLVTPVSPSRGGLLEATASNAVCTLTGVTGLTLSSAPLRRANSQTRDVSETLLD